VPNAVDLDPAADIQSTSKALFTRSEIAVGVAFDADISNTTNTDIKTTISVASKTVDSSLRVKVMVVLSPALSLSTSLLMAIVGTLVSIVKSTELFASQLPSVVMLINSKQVRAPPFLLL
jgi:hypothetical protein